MIIIIKSYQSWLPTKHIFRQKITLVKIIHSEHKLNISFHMCMWQGSLKCVLTNCTNIVKYYWLPVTIATDKLEVLRKTQERSHKKETDLQNQSTMKMLNKWKLSKLHLKGQYIDNYNVYLFVSCSKENFKISKYQKLQPIRPILFHFIWFFVNSIIPRVSDRPLYCVFIEVNFKK